MWIVGSDKALQEHWLKDACFPKGETLSVLKYGSPIGTAVRGKGFVAGLRSFLFQSI